MSTDDRQLLRQISNRERRAFEELYNAYYGRVFRFVYRVTRRGDLVEEIVQESLLVVWRDAARYDGRSRVSSWILGIAYRRAMKALESESRRRHRESAWAESATERSPAGYEPERTASSRETRALVWRALADLSPDQRAVVELTLIEGCAYAEIAELMSCPVNTVKSRMYYARQRLKTLLPDLGISSAAGS